MVPRLPHTDVQTLSAHDFKVTVEPGTGALIRAIEWQAPDETTHQLLYSPGDVAATSKMPNRFGAWAMVPFANRAFGGILRDGALVYDLPINAPDGEATIHGFGWQSAWDVSHSSAARLILRHSRSEMSGPYHYTAQLSISLVPGTVAIALSVVNLGDIALPYGIGLHPWFPCAQDTRLALHADGEFLFAPGYRATGRSDFTDGGPFSTDRIFQTGQEVAHSFIGWGGTATVSTPSSGLALTILASENLRSPVVWAPADAPFLCIEPQSHGIGAPSEPVAAELTPMTRLAPGETLSGWMRLTPGLVERSA